MLEDILLEAESLGDVIFKIRERVIVAKPLNFPADPKAGRAVLEIIEHDIAAFSDVLISVLASISMASEALTNPYISNHIPDINAEPFNRFKAAAYNKYFTQSELKEISDALCLMWERHTKSMEFVKKLPAFEEGFHKMLIDGSLFAEAREAAGEEFPPNIQAQIDRIYSWPQYIRQLMCFAFKQHHMVSEVIDQFRTVLAALRKIFVVMRALAERLKEFLGSSKDANRDSGESIITDDGPFPPNIFKYQGKESMIGRPLVWRLVQSLWKAERWTVSFDDLAESVWLDRELIVDDSTIGSLRRDANKIFNREGIPLAISTSNRYCVMQPNFPCSESARPALEKCSPSARKPRKRKKSKSPPVA